jgi:hypothetical protein
VRKITLEEVTVCQIIIIRQAKREVVMVHHQEIGLLAHGEENQDVDLLMGQSAPDMMIGGITEIIDHPHPLKHIVKKAGDMMTIIMSVGLSGGESVPLNSKITIKLNIIHLDKGPLREVEQNIEKNVLHQEMKSGDYLKGEITGVLVQMVILLKTPVGL